MDSEPKKRVFHDPNNQDETVQERHELDTATNIDGTSPMINSNPNDDEGYLFSPYFCPLRGIYI